MALLALIAWLIPINPASAQAKRHVPVVDKIGSSSTHQMFNGKVQSLDLGHNLLTVNTMQGADIEIFPVSRSVRVIAPNGDRMKLNELKPGANILVSYEQKGDRRTVKKISVLKAGTKEGGKKSSPPS